MSGCSGETLATRVEPGARGGGAVAWLECPIRPSCRRRRHRADSLLSVHAHPDDEASKGAPTIARYHAEGVHTVLVCCTGGEEGDLQNRRVSRVSSSTG